MKERLIGRDAILEKVTFGTEMTTGTMLVGKFYKISAKGGTSIFGASVVGDLFRATDTAKTLASGDKCVPLEETPFLDSTGWELSISAKEVDISVAADEFDKFRKGRASADGTIKGIIMPAITLQSGGLLNRFIKMVAYKKDGSITVSQIDESPIFLKAVIQKDTTAGETYAFMFCQIEMFGIKLKGGDDSPQDYDSKFKLNGADPVFYTVEA